MENVEDYIEELMTDIEMIDVELNGCCYGEERKQKLMLKKSILKEIRDLRAKLED